MGRDAMRRNHSQAQHHVLQMMDSEPPPPAYSAAAAAASWLRRDVGAMWVQDQLRWVNVTDGEGCRKQRTKLDQR